ncbi:HAL/PAL/TAL family ammonia-lyase [Nocardia yamanashiensis]|uniref:HAL/PAL/TAL family ammonia-lyase n=1 Tax=Nocardia yamanashiensis TaxID=209247 RepID=UPI000AE66A37|nr:aromatic amino acid ammonia-lyase [Nocardia yamanashiensis]
MNTRTASMNELRADIRLPARLTPELLERVAKPAEIELAPVVWERIDLCREFVSQRLQDGTPIYGSTTGFGPLVEFAGRDLPVDQCDNILYHLTAGQGEDLPERVVRAAALARLWSLAQGRSGVSQAVPAALIAMLRTDFAPAVPRLGSLGASGDLIPLAHLAGALRGQGHAYVSGRRLPADEALAVAGLAPLALDGRDGLAMVNGTSVTAATAGLALASIRRSHSVAIALTALLVDLLGCDPGFLSAELLEAFGHAEAAEVSARLRTRLTGTTPTGTRSLQEPYSIRCAPHLLGAVGNSLLHSGRVISDDLNGVSDNPLFFPETDTVVHGGNFFGQPVAFVADLLTMGAVQMGNLAERQLDLLVDPHRNGGLPPMLATEPGKQHGVQGVQLAATATLANMRRTAMPASIQSIPTNGHNQDVIPFGTQAALNALDTATSLRWLHGSLAVALRQAVYVGARRPTAPACAAIIDQLIETITPIDPDRPLDSDVRAAAALLDTLVDTETQRH